MRRTAALALGAHMALGCAGLGRDPVTADPPVDRQAPARLDEATLDSDGSRLNAIVYVAAGDGPHPTAVLLHGFPGNERNLDLAQALRRAGWNVLFFHYRGAWGSGGDFSFSHVLGDVANVVATVGDPAFAEAHRIDPRRIALVGHSMGGFAALVSGAELPAVDCVVSIAGANFGARARAMAGRPEAAAAAAARLDAWSGPLSGTSGAALVAEIGDNAERFDVLAHADALAEKPVLLVAGTRDETTPIVSNHAPLVEALEAHGASALDHVELDSDHAFSDHRIALSRVVTRWMTRVCR